MLQMIHLDPNIEDSITWKLTNDGFYYSKSAYAMQFLGKMTSYMTLLVWKWRGVTRQMSLMKDLWSGKSND
jgi:hypothetical protein